MEVVYQPVRLEVSLINYCTKQKLMRALWVYSILRDKGYNHGGYSVKVDSLGGLSKSRTLHYIKVLKDLGWVEVNSIYYKAVSIKKIIQDLNLKGRSALEITPDCVRSYNKFKLHCFSAQVESLLRMQHNMCERRDRTWKDSKISESVETIKSNTGVALTAGEFQDGIFFHKQGQISTRVISAYTGASTGYISGMKNIAKSTGYLHVIPEILMFGSEADAKELTNRRLIPYYYWYLAAANAADSPFPVTRVADSIFTLISYTKKRYNVGRRCNSNVDYNNSKKHL